MGDSKRKVNDGMDASSHPSGWGGGPGAGVPAQGVGASLREARQRLGVELRDVADMLRIRYVFLQAIEDGRYGDLPGNAYAAGFLRSYAEYLGLDADGVVRRFKDEVAGRAAKQELYFPTPVPEGRVPGGALLLAALVLAGTVYGGWYYLSATDRSMVDLVPALPDRLVSLLDNLPFSSTTQPLMTADSGADSGADGEADSGADPEAGGEAPVGPSATGEPAAEASAMPAVAEAEPPPARPSAVPPPAVPAPAVVAAAPAPAPATGGAATITAPVPGAAPADAGASPAARPAAAAATAETPGEIVPPVKPDPAAVAAASGPVSEPAAAAGADAATGAATGAVAEDEPEGAAQEPTPLNPAAPALPAVAALPGSTAAADAAAAVATPPTRVYGTQNQDSRIQLRATQDSWVQVRDGKGELLFTRVLRPGDVYRVPDRPGVRLRTGNAGGLIVVVDGVAGSPLGASGQVLRDVALDAPALR